MIGLIPLLLALTIVETAAQGVRTGAALGDAAPALALGLGAVLVLGLWAAAWRRPRPRALYRLDLAVQAGLLGWLAVLCLGVGWVGRADPMAHTRSLAPWLAGLCLWWFLVAPAMARATGVAWTRRGYLLHQVRLGMLPVLLLLPVIDGAVLLFRATGYEAYLHEHGWIAASSIAGSVAVGLLAVVAMPVVLVRLWGARPMPPGTRRDTLAALCVQARVRVRDILSWPVAGGRMHNAALVGAVPGLRYVLFTDDLLRDLEPEHLHAVLGHELGHARHGHLWIYLVFAVVALSASILLHDALLPLLGSWGQQHPDAARLLVAIGLLALFWRIAFGVVSRACERQADLAGADLAGGPSVMAAALARVAAASGQSPDAPSWRHFSIRQRMDFLAAVERHPALATEHHRAVGSMRLALIVCALALAGLVGVAAWQAAHQPAPAVALAAQAAADPVLDDALAAADGGRPAPLGHWLASQEPRTRQQIAVLLIQHLPTQPGTPLAPYRPLWRRLAPFAELGTGDAGLDEVLENLLAYLLVSAALEPQERDVATRLLPRLEAAMARTPTAEVWDTIGCVRYRLGDHARAGEAFALAASLIDPPDAAFALLVAARRRASAEAVRCAELGAVLPALPMEGDPNLEGPLP
jgi:Zn-dependent protease with chaperone function